jgi:hypothetical protein
MNTPAENAEPLRFPAAAVYLWYAFVASMAFMKPSLRIAGNYVQFSELVFLAFAAVAAAYIIYRRRLPRLGGLWLPLLVYIGAFTISAAFSPRPFTSFVKLTGVAYLAAIAAAAVAVIRDEALCEKPCSSLLRAAHSRPWRARLGPSSFI